jgi:hypothetical protein
MTANKIVVNEMTVMKRLETIVKLNADIINTLESTKYGMTVG